jgi:hypothetical protein
LNNYGFYVEKKHPGDSVWSEIQNSFVPGHGTTNEPQHYSVADSNAEIGTWLYRLKQVDLGGPIAYFDPIEINVLTDVKEVTPIQFTLQQNFPNPFNPTTSISYALPRSSTVSLKVYDALGQEIVTLVNQTQSAGYHEVVWSGRNSDGANVSSGIYFYRIEANGPAGSENFIQLKKMVLLK